MHKPLKNDERGLSHILLILLGVIVLGVIGFVGWKVTQKGSETVAKKAANAITSKAISAECLKEYNDKDYCKYAANFTFGTEAMVMTSKSSGEGANNTSLLKMDGKGNTYTKTEGGGQSNEAILLNKVSYWKDNSDGKWFKMTSRDEEKPQDDNKVEETVNDPNDKPEDPAKKHTIKKIGKEACGNLTCFKYQDIDPAATDEIHYVWFDDKDYKLRKTYDKAASLETETSYSYEAVKISEPSPVKEFNANPSQAEIEALQQQAQQYMNAQ